jgi:hypothetical protein
MTREEHIQQLAAQFETNGLEKEQTFEYATNQVNGVDYQKFVQVVHDVFIGCK